ncbi:MAG: glycosyltransferase family 2 protein [Candidatus Magasanikiibacteriota bacterium]
MGYHLKKALTVGNIEYIIGGVGSMFRTSIIKKVGYYSTDTVTEDIDLTMKVVGLGNKKNLMVYAEDVVVYTESTLTIPALFKQRFRWKFGRFQTFWKNRSLFFNKDKKYSRYLTFIYLPFQLFSELTFLFDPLLIGYIAYLSIRFGSPSSYYGMFLFLMFFTVFAIASDNESSIKDSSILLLLSPLSYIMFFLVSVVEYAGLIQCIIKWKEIIYASRYNRCGWTPVERLGRAITT